jgi:hypothetical protein
VAVHSEGGGVKVDGNNALQGRRGRGQRRRCDNDQEWRTDDLRKRMATARSEVRDEVAACYGVGIKDDRWWGDSFLGDRRVRESVGPKILVCGT